MTPGILGPGMPNMSSFQALDWHGTKSAEREFFWLPGADWGLGNDPTLL